MGLVDTFQQINGALNGKSGGGSLNKGGKGPDISMSPREANMAKMKALGLTTMPDGGQDELDSMWGAHIKKVNGAK